jgi:hypothetical protein
VSSELKNAASDSRRLKDAGQNGRPAILANCNSDYGGHESARTPDRSDDLAGAQGSPSPQGAVSFFGLFGEQATRISGSGETEITPVRRRPEYQAAPRRARTAAHACGQRAKERGSSACRRPSERPRRLTPRADAHEATEHAQAYLALEISRLRDRKNRRAWRG